MTLETAKQLKELGWDKETRNKVAEFTDGSYGAYSGGTYKELFPSPSLEELLAVMPSYILVSKGNYIVSTKGRVTNEMFLHIKKGELYWACYTDSYSNNLEGFIFSNEVFSEAAAMLWIKLRKEGIV